jgi:hypothetical protein
VTGDEPAADYRPGDHVPEDAVMVKGAPVTVPILRSNVRKTRKRFDFYGTSMFAFPDCGEAGEVAERAGIPHDEICWSTAGAIRAEGFELRRTFDRPGHFSLVFAGNPSEADLERVLRLFAECEENEHKRSG